MRAGRLNKRVTFQRLARDDDGGGGGAKAWVPLLTVWGSYAPERGRERLEAGRVSSAIGGVLTVRSSTQTRAVTSADRVLIDEVPHQIRSAANPDQRSRSIEMIVESGVAS